MNPAQGLALGAGKSYADLVNVAASECAAGRMRVVPGDPANSYLVQKLEGVSLCSGTQMPKTGSIPASDITTIKAWICNGAPNN